MNKEAIDFKNKTIVIFYMLYFGDTIAITPFLSVLRRNAEGSHIILVCDKPCYEAVAYDPNVDEVIPVDRKKMGLAATWAFGKELGKKKPDILFVLHGTTRTTMMALAMHPKCWIGEAGSRLDSLFMERKILVDRYDRHAMKQYVEALEVLGLTDTAYDGLEIYTSEERKEEAAEFYRKEGVAEEERLVGISVGSTRTEKNWPAESFGRAADRMFEKGYRPVFFGIKSELPLIETALSVMEHKEKAVVAAGKLSMGGFMAAAARCDIALTNDSGPMYVFDGNGVPTVAFFGPSNAKRHHPLGKRSVALASTEMPITQDPVTHTIKKRNYIPISVISVDEAIRAAEWALGDFESEEYASHIKFIK